MINISDKKIDNFPVLFFKREFERFFKLKSLFKIKFLRLKIIIIALTQSMEEQMENN